MSSKYNQPVAWDYRYQGDTKPSIIAGKPFPRPRKAKQGFQKQLCAVCNQFVHNRAMRNHMDAHKRGEI